MAVTGVKRTIVYLFDNSQAVNEEIVSGNSLVQSLFNNSANYLAPVIKWEYIQFDIIGSGTISTQTALAYEFFLTASGDANFTTANLATLAQQLGVSSIPTFSEQIIWGT